MKSKNIILVTGGAGNIGSGLINKLSINKSNTIICIDNLTTGSLNKINKSKNILFKKIDVNKLSQISNVFNNYKIDFVFHFAALVGVKRTLENPLKVFNDIKGIKNILELSKSNNVKKVFFSSSSEVYGEPFEIPQNEETTPLNARLPYAIVKNLGESYFRAYFQLYGLNYTIFRFFNTYGPNQSTDFVISKFISLALNNKDITVYGDGLQTRTFCFIDDNVDTMINILSQNICNQEVINIGSDYEIPIIDLAKIIIDLLKSKSKIIHLPPLKEGDMKRRKPDITKMKNIIKRELVDLEDGIKITAKHLKINE